MLPKANYHTHTYRCGHAEGEDREYVEAAIARGIKILGFSDHTPMIYEGGFYSGCRMGFSEAEGYFRSIEALRDEYKDDIEIHIGFEAEYYPETHERYMEIIKQYPVEYLILGQHFIYREETGETSGSPSDDPGKLKSYYANVIEGLKTGHYLYAAHPDMVFFTGDAAVYEEETRKFLTEVKKLDIPVEINRLGFSTKRHYPYEPFWKIAGEVGNKAIIGTDAHSPSHFDDISAVEGCMRLAEKYGVELLGSLGIG